MERENGEVGWSVCMISCMCMSSCKNGYFKEIRNDLIVPVTFVYILMNKLTEKWMYVGIYISTN